MIKFLKDHTFILFLLLSFCLFTMSNGEWNIPLFAWIYPILFLKMFSLNKHRIVYISILILYVIGFMIQFRRAIGMDITVCFAVGVGLSIGNILPYLYWMKSKQQFHDTIVFACLMVIIEYSIYILYPILGGLSDAYTQYQNPYMLQIVTITGVYGITFFMYWTAAIIIWIWNHKNNIQYIKKYLILYLSIIGFVFIYGIAMFHFGGNSDKSIRIAGVSVPISNLLNDDKDVYSTFYTNTFTDENITNTRDKLSTVTNELFLKTKQEAQSGAKIVFWSELNGAVLKQDEEILLQKASDLAKQEGIYLILSLLVKTPYEELKENKTIAFNPQGESISEYYKYGKSLGELCQKGDGILKSFDTEYGNIAPFICSDLAFLSKIQQAGKDNVDILIVPASDWKEMALLSTKTAIMRGVENGCNIIRHTNRGISMVSDVKGNILAQADYFQSDTKTISAQVPTNGRFTLYSYIGNLFVYLCAIYVIGYLLYPKMQRITSNFRHTAK